MLVEQLLLLFIVSSFAYLVGVWIGKVSDKEIRKNPKAFIKLDYYVWLMFMFVTLILAMIETWYSVVGILFAYLIVINIQKKMVRFTALPLILGLSAAFRNDFLVILLALGTFYVLIFGMIHHKNNQMNLVLRNQMRYVILSFVGLFIPITIYTVFGMPEHQITICAIFVSFLASMILIGNHENMFKGKSKCKLAGV